MMEDENKQKLINTLCERLGWQVATRNDSLVAKALNTGEEIDAMHNLTEAGLLDGFFAFMKESKVMDVLSSVNAQSRHRVIVPICLFVLTYMTKIILGIKGMNPLPELLLSNQAIMTLIGFNATMLENGICNRGSWIRGEAKNPPTPFCVQTLSNLIEAFSESELEFLFNNVIAALARFGAFPKTVTGIIDGTKIPTTDKYDDCGMISQTSKRVDKQGEVREIVEYIYGFKLVALIELKTQIPVAVKVSKIEDHDANFTIDLIKQAMENLKGYSVITKLLCDRGFLDGQDFYLLDSWGITFVCPLKSNMEIYTDALSLCESEDAIVRDRTKTITHGSGRNKTQETLQTTVVGIKDLTTFETYCSPEELKHKNRKNFSPKPINAVVVKKWENKEFESGKGVVYITNGSVENPLNVFDDYDFRSIIENLLFREGKQAWDLTDAPKKTKEAMTSHVILTMVTFAITQAYRHWAEGLEPSSDTDSKPITLKTGKRRWERELEAENRDKVIVFYGNHYGIFDISEVAVLTGIKIKQIPKELGSRDDILAKYGLKE